MYASQRYVENRFSPARFLILTLFPLLQPLLLILFPFIYDKQSGDSWAFLGGLIIGVSILFTIGLLFDFVLTTFSIIGIIKESNSYALPLCLNGALLLLKLSVLFTIYVRG